MASDKFIYNNTSEQETYSMESTQESSSLSVQTSVEGEQYSADIKVQNDALSVQASNAGNEYDFSAVAETDKLNVSESEEGDEYELDLTIYNDEMYLRGFLKSPSRYKFSLIIENDSFDIEQEENVAVGKKAYYTKEETLQLLSQKADWTASLAKYGIKDAYIEGRVIHLGGRSIAVPESGGSGGGGSSWLDDYLLPIYDDFGNVMGIQSIVGIASDSFLSAKGLDDDSAEEGGGFDEELMWIALGGSLTNKIVADQYLPTNLVRTTRKVAGFSLSQDVTVTNLSDALSLSRYLLRNEFADWQTQLTALRELFNTMFELVPATSEEPQYIRAKLGVASDSFLSAKGMDDDDSAGGGFDEELMWIALGGSLTNKIIADQYLPSNIVKSTRKVAGYSLSEDITITNLSDALSLSRYLLRNEFSDWQNKLVVLQELFDAMFELVPATSEEPQHIRAKLGVASDSFLSAKGMDDDETAAGGFDEELMWMALGGSLTNKVIADQHLPSNIVRNTRKVAGFSLSQDVTITNLSDALSLSRYLLRSEFSGWQSQLTAFRELFDTMFELVPATNDEPKHIRAKLGVASDSFLSAKGMDDDDSAGSSFDEELMWMALGGSLANKIIADSHISSNIARVSAFSNYYTKAEVAALIPNLSSYYTKEQTDKILTGYASIDFVNSSLSTATATFRGTFETVAALPTINVNVNDYAFVIVEGEYRRYKYNGTSWVFEYTLNNSGYTAEQWSAVNSGITEDLVELIGINEGNIDLNARNIKTNTDAINTLTNRVNEFGESLTTLEGLFDSDGKVQNAVNADLLEGHAASYFATKARVDALDTGIGTRIGDLETEIETISKDYINSGELTNAINALGVPALKTRVQNLETAVGDLDEFVSDFEEIGYVTIATHNSAISGLDTRIKANVTAISNLSTDYEGFDERLDSAEANISTNTTTITAQGKTIASHTSSINTLTSDVNGLKASVSDLEDLFDSDGKALKAVTADNASKLNGQSASYYATAASVKSVSDSLANYALKTRKISAGTGLTGGGDLTADRTLSLATSGVTAGTYTKTTVDAYGRVTGGTTLAASDIPALAISKITNLQTTLDGLRTDVDNAISDAGDNAAAIVTLTDSLSKLTTRVSTAESNITALGNNKLNKSVWDSVFEIDSNGNLKVKVGLYSPKFISSREADPNTGGGSGGAFSLYTWTQVKALTSEVSGAAPTAYALKQAYNEINTSLDGKASESSVASLTTRVASLETKATSVSVSQTLTTGTEIGKITIDGVSKALYAPSSIAWGSVTGKPSFATVATSGKYSDLSGLPTIPTNTNQLTNGAGFITASAIPSTYAWTSITGKPTFATVATSGSYNDLSNKPTIPSLAGYATESWVGSNYLPLSGGTIDGNIILNGNITITRESGALYLNTTSTTIPTAINFFKNLVNYGGLGMSEKNIPCFLDVNNTAHTLIHSGNYSDYALPLSGGTITGTGVAPLLINTSASDSSIVFRVNSTSKTQIGYNPSIGSFIFNYASSKSLGIKDDGTPHFNGNTLIHSGNIGSQSVASATKATQDGNGNVIASTYATKPEANRNGVFIMFHRKSDSFPLMVEPDKWPNYQSSGEIAEGVVIVDGGKMLVVAPTETSLYWSSAAVSGGGYTTTDRIKAFNDWNGKANTAAQAAKAECSGTNYAAGYCAQYSRTNANGNGLTAGKWWLPSMGEMMMIYANMRKVNYALSLIEGATQLAEAYWSSTEYDATFAWRLVFSEGNATANTKATVQYRVRPVSAFYNTENTTIMPWDDIISSPHLSQFTAKLNNVASATKLATPRTIWGQSFDGTGDVSGSISHTNGWSFIDPSDNYVIFGYDYAHNNKPIYIDGKEIYLRYGTGHTNGLILNSSGNVTIGASDLAGTSAKLYVNGKVETSGEIFLNNERSIRMKGSDATYYNVLFKSGTDLHVGYDSPAIRLGNSKMTINSSGNVLIGTTTDSGYKLDVNGTCRVTGNATFSGSIYSATGVYSAGYVSARGADTSSDRRLKDNIAPLRNALNYVLKTNYVSFDWKDTREKSIGIIAQEEMGREWGCLVQKHSETYSYLYGQHTALLGAALQEEDRKVEELKAEISRLRAKVNELETRLNS